MTKSSNAATATLDDEAVFQFLESDPNFFNRNPESLLNILLPNPHGEGVISLPSKQMEVLRHQLNKKNALLSELMSYGKANDQINEQVHRLSTRLLRLTDTNALRDLVKNEIPTIFNLTQAIYLSIESDCNSAPEAFSSWAKSLSAPYCNGINDAIQSLIDANILGSDLASFSIIPIHSADETSSIYLVLAADDPNHFTQEMGTAFLRRIGELFSSTISGLSKQA